MDVWLSSLLNPGTLVIGVLLIASVLVWNVCCHQGKLTRRTVRDNEADEVRG